MMDTQVETGAAREAKLKRALFRGDKLRLDNPAYLGEVRTILETLCASDIGAGDLTIAALGLAREHSTGRVLAKEPGIAAGVDEYCWLMSRNGVQVNQKKKDGERVAHDETMVEIAGERGKLLAYERVGLNLLQRMSGIATATRKLQELARRRNAGTSVVGTRKTPWGLLDKRAVHLGGGGTHRLGLGEAILVKNNHLALLGSSEAEAAREAIRRAWPYRQQANFIEVEVRGQDAALAAAREFREWQGREPQEKDAPSYPCLLMLDNLQPAEVSRILAALREEELFENVLIEASGNISEGNIEAYAACGVDAISIGALTHSPRGLDICQRVP
jgi:nicotinate-nucleotide pyrophosphorylase (carboxylating)